MNLLGAIFEAFAGLGAVAGIGFYLACLWSARSYLKDRGTRSGTRPNQPPAEGPPPVSILKPLKGEDPDIYQSFRSHCLQDYPQYEIIFGVSDADDPATRAVERLRQEFPQCAIQLLVCSQTLGANTKVSNLAQMVKAARYDHLIVSDSDIRVGPDYLRKIVAPLADAKVGMVTCLYRGIASPTLGSKLESLGISTDFAAGVLVARYIEGGVRFALGSTMAFRRRDLEAIGGFESFVDYLADDYELGKRIAALGFEVRLSEVVVETFLPAYDLRQFFEHQLRWARGVRDSRRGGYLGLLFTFGWPWALLALLLSRGAPWAWELAGLAVVLRLLVAWTVGVGVLRDSRLARLLPLLPLRDLMAVAIWFASFASNTVAWRGDRFHLKNGQLVRIPS
ncbi:MAG: bacteriohopanetetrol glucosamine biosynthesis glycosyltransferase HpnI [Terriglobales bacterium]